MNRPALCLIAAVARNGAIGKNNQLLVHLPGDLPRFKKITLGCPVVMGRKTWDSLPERFRPLPQRRNIVITRNVAWQAAGAEAAASLADALAAVASEPKVFVIGGAQIYAQLLPRCTDLYLTVVFREVEGDAFFPAFEEEFTLHDVPLRTPNFEVRHFRRR